jgi:TM2 domain-containing membrane protein YozV
MKKLLFLTVSLFFVAITANATNYELNNKMVDNMFDQATEISFASDAGIATSNDLTFTSNDELQKKVMIAFIVNWVGLGGFGVHRHILGTKGNMWAVYTFTCCGIFGIVPMIDWFVLLIDGLINKNYSAYIDNEEFFMWK